MTSAKTSAPPAARRPRPRAGAQGGQAGQAQGGQAGQAAPPTGTAAAPQRDWKNPDDYRFTEGLDVLGWAWQFLRRNAAYKRQCEHYIGEVAARGETLLWFGPYFHSGGELDGRFVFSDVGELPILDTRIELPGSAPLRLAFQGWLGDPRHLPEFEDYNPLSWTQKLSGNGEPGAADRGWGRGPYVGFFRVFLEFDLAPQFAWIQEYILSLQALYAEGTRERPLGIVGGRLKIRRLEWGISKSGNRERFKLYLRVLDGDAAGAKPRQIGEKLFSDLLKGIPPKPATPAKRNEELMAREKRDAERRAKAQRKASNRARDALEAAQGLTREPWVILLSNPPRRQLRERKIRPSE